MRTLHIIHFDVYSVYLDIKLGPFLLGCDAGFYSEIRSIFFIMLNFDEALQIALKGTKLNNNVEYILCDKVTITRI